MFERITQVKPPTKSARSRGDRRRGGLAHEGRAPLIHPAGVARVDADQRDGRHDGARDHQRRRERDRAEELASSVEAKIIDGHPREGAGAPVVRSAVRLHSAAPRVSRPTSLAFGMKLMARSAIAVIVSEGFTPGFALIEAPSMTKRPS